MHFFKKGKWFLPLSLSTLVLAACGGDDSGEASGDDSNEADDENGEIELAYVAWESEVASNNVIRLVLEEAGYDVNLNQVEQAAMWQSVAQGDTDGHVAGWLPSDMATDYERYGDEVVDLGPNLEGNRTGLAVPDYMDVTSIEEVNSDNFDEIVGIDPGAGVVDSTEQAVEAYDMDISVQTSSDAAMTAALDDAIENEEPIVVTAWEPHWKFNTYDIRFLEDPEGIYEEEEEIRTMVREGLEEDEPEAYQILDNFYWETDDMNEVMLDISENDTDPEEAAQAWIDDNRDMVDEWLETDSEE
ncbi:glycine betaine ABC transporter substrate-binding protein [Salicibibacter halophilus]|uniref:Glycine betaine ABC transporter substrate-binding protein n=1 Tax=Salicibibacter halophilus TaxID=2502791 RepID=A0A514LM51_9BACI|nr:glycine betaine ABC transporter substrate-binding protein [Salicibibacter halophilus]QDI92331.1 glycine betaine ABC transporter substrate-binding protein [Salicibibacter halophilus]